MRGPLGRGPTKNWRRQGPNFGPRLASLSTRSRAKNWTQIRTPGKYGGIGNLWPWRWRVGLNTCWGDRGVLGRGLVRPRGIGETPGTGQSGL